jgi:hypothetical protein
MQNIRRIRLVVLIFIMSIIFVAAAAGKQAMGDENYNTVLGLLSQCQEVAKNRNKVSNQAYWGLCQGRIEGYFVATEKWAQPAPFCAPININRQDIIETFVNWAERNPGKWYEPAYVGLLTSLKAAFPCGVGR